MPETRNQPERPTSSHVSENIDAYVPAQSPMPLNTAYDPNIQFSTADKVYQSNGDKEWPLWEDSARVKALPKSLFFDAGTADDSLIGLFNYYVLGERGDAGNGKVTYHKSETYQQNQSITPEASRNPTASNIIKITTISGDYKRPSSPYRGQLFNVKDFIFCKHYGVIPNNRMLTLRRFPHPITDNMVVPEFTIDLTTDENNKISTKRVQGIAEQDRVRTNIGLPIAQAVTYFGGDSNNDLNDIIGFSTGLKWNLQHQDPMLNAVGNDPGILNGPWKDTLRKVAGDAYDFLEAGSDILGSINDPQNKINAINKALLDRQVSESGPLSKKIFVDVNTVSEMYTRGIGLESSHEFTIKFHYVLTSVSEINSRMLFLDLLGNLLTIGTDYGKFLAPELRHETARQGIGFPGGAERYIQMLTDPVKYLQTTLTDITSGDFGKRFKQLVNSANELRKEFSDWAEDPSKPIKQDTRLFKTLTSLLTTNYLNAVHYQPIMLSGYPVGEWHLTVGNPLNPIATIGNLICTNVKIDFNSVLGPDDFPTEMTASFSLKNARARHRGDFESMFNRGNGRFYLGKLPHTTESKNVFVTAQSGTDITSLGGDFRNIVQETGTTNTESIN